MGVDVDAPDVATVPSPAKSRTSPTSHHRRGSSESSSSSLSGSGSGSGSSSPTRLSNPNALHRTRAATGGGGGPSSKSHLTKSSSPIVSHPSASGSMRDSWSPTPTRETFKDLLIFEERLKQNAERLQKQRRQYEAFLVSLSILIIYFAYKVFVLPSIYSLVHYFNISLLLVSLVTLALFFATGMYSEKIAYAYRFVPQANRALRPLNIYLNTRKRSWISYFSLFRFAASPPIAQPPSLTTTPKPGSSPISNNSPTSSADEASDSSLSRSSKKSSGMPPHSRRKTSISSLSSESSLVSNPSTIRSSRSQRSSPSSSRTSSPSSSSPPRDAVTRTLPPTIRRSPSRSSSPHGGTTQGVPLPPIPPAQNPRGELIFSSRVSPLFREGYERYRSEWEKKRKRSEAAAASHPPHPHPHKSSLSLSPTTRSWTHWLSLGWIGGAGLESTAATTSSPVGPLTTLEKNPTPLSNENRRIAPPAASLKERFESTSPPTLSGSSPRGEENTSLVAST